MRRTLPGALLLVLTISAILLGAASTTVPRGTVALSHAEAVLACAMVAVLTVGVSRAAAKRRLAPLLLGVLPGACWVVAALVGGWIADAQALRQRDRLEPVIAALEEYRAEQGEYPEALADLVPAHLPHVPRGHRGIWSVEVEYRRFPPGPDGEPASYHLRVPRGIGNAWQRYGPGGEWYLDS